MGKDGIAILDHWDTTCKKMLNLVLCRVLLTFSVWLRKFSCSVASMCVKGKFPRGETFPMSSLMAVAICTAPSLHTPPIGYINRRNGILFIPASGRSSSGMFSAMGELGQDLLRDGAPFISMNGLTVSLSLKLVDGFEPSDI